MTACGVVTVGNESVLALFHLTIFKEERSRCWLINQNVEIE